MVTNLDVQIWQDAVKGINEYGKTDLTQEEWAALMSLNNSLSSSNFNSEESRRSYRLLKDSINRHDNNPVLQRHLQNFIALCEKYSNQETTNSNTRKKSNSTRIIFIIAIVLIAGFVLAKNTEWFNNLFSGKQQTEAQVEEFVNEIEALQELDQNRVRSVYVVTAGYYDGDDSEYYVDSYARKQQNNAILHPRLWNDGRIQTLSNKNSGSAHSVFVAGDDVYVAGEQNGYPTLWKNGVIQQLSKEQGGCANSVFVSGNDVYVVGNDDYFATLWKNGVPQKLTDGKDYACANSVFVSGGDVFVVGMVDQVATLWKNGVAQTLTGGSEANSVFISGKNVFVAGSNSDDGAALLWKNGKPHIISKGKDNNANDLIFAHSVFVSGNDVYVAGSTESNRAKLWKNGVEQKLTDESGSAAYSVFVSGNDVYVAGWIGGYATLWKNGVPQRICNVRSVFATSVFVK